VRSAFSWSYRALPPEAARLFRLLGLHPGPDISASAATALAGTRVGRVRRLLDILADGNLIEETSRDRYRFHDLLRLYAAECTEAEEPQRERRGAICRILTWYLHTAEAARHVLVPHRGRLQLEPPEPSCEPLAFTDYAQALTWFDAEHSSLAEAIRLAAEIGEHGIAWKLATAMWSFFILRKPWDEWVNSCINGLDSARQIGDGHGQAQILNSMGDAFSDLGDFAEAIKCYQDALAIRREIDDPHGKAASMINLGVAYFRLQCFEAALGYHQQGLAIGRLIGDRYYEGAALLGLGETHGGMRHLDNALTCFRLARAAFHEIGERSGEATVLHHLGHTGHELGQSANALGHYRQALAIRREIGDRQGQAWTLDGLGSVLRDTGHPQEARDAWAEALAILEALGDPRQAELRDRLGTS
jgi:tetratricopeptide (TPR) repeat protein